MITKLTLLVGFIMSSVCYAQTTKKYFFELSSDFSKNRKAHYLMKKYDPLYNKKSWQVNLTDDQLKKLVKTDGFEYLERDSVQRFIEIENTDILFDKSMIWSEHWHLNRVNVEQAWKDTKGSASVIVGVCDSGIKADHADLIGRVLPGWNFINEDDDTSPNTNHGTAVSGFIAANANSLGFSGVAPNVSLLPGKIVTTSGGVPKSAMLSCIRWAADKGAKVINVSMTGVNSPSSATAARYANSKGALVVWAAGNQNYSTRWIDKKEILAVGGIDIEDQRYFSQVVRESGVIKNFGSNTGPFVDIAAPGEDVYTLRIDESYKRSNGTSYAAPIVSGVAALVYSINPNLSPRQVTKILEKSADDLGNSRFFGKGVVNAGKAVELAKKSL